MTWVRSEEKLSKKVLEAIREAALNTPYDLQSVRKNISKPKEVLMSFEELLAAYDGVRGTVSILTKKNNAANAEIARLKALLSKQSDPIEDQS